MDKKQYCEKLLEFKDNEIPLSKFWGGRWIFLKIVLILLGGFLIIYPGVETKVLGGIALGYAFGKIAAGIMSYKLSKQTWPYTKELLNWDEIEETIKNPNKVSSTDG